MLAHITRKLLFLFFLQFAAVAFPQRTQKDIDKLAIQYYEAKEFEKANVYFDELFSKSPDAWYNYYYKSLIEAKDYSRAEKITRRLMKANKNNVFLYVYLGRIYRLEGDEKKEREAYERAIKDLQPYQPFLENLAAAFKEQKLYDRAIEVYNKGRKANPEYPYYYERAEVYKLKNDLAAMINEYLDALEFRETELQTVQANLQNSLGYDDERGGIKNPLLRQELQKRIQKHPDRIVFSEFLIFIQKQQGDFDGAFVQSRALDKRLKEDGFRIYELAKLCKNNRQWETARRCYEYIASKGTANIYYDAAVIDGLEVEYLSVTQKANPSKEELLALEQKLSQANEKYQQNVLNNQIVKSLAMVRAYYLNNEADAITLLEGFINRAGIESAVKAEFKLLLGDIYLVSGDIWEASLLYSQVEKAFKYEAIGNEAKYRNAKLSFYAGDFKWAKTQADVLKGATSKLIANDALDLSLIITDAIGVDTNELPLKMFSSAELMILQHRYDEAISRLDSINMMFNNHTLGDDIYFKKAQIFFTRGKYAETEEMYRNIIEYFPTDLYGDDAQFRLADLYEKQLNDPAKAKQAYQDLLVRYPGSIFTVEARKRFRDLRGDAVNN